MTTQRQVDSLRVDYLEKLAHESALEWIDDLIRTTETGLVELRRMRERFAESTRKEDTFATPVNVISWTIGAVQNIQRNYRLDLAANHAAALTAAAHRRGR